jgi:hypothetical protein
MSAVEKRREVSCGGLLGFGSQYVSRSSVEAIDMAMPAPPPVAVSAACQPPSVTTEATIWNVEKCFGFVSSSEAVIRSRSSVAAR